MVPFFLHLELLLSFSVPPSLSCAPPNLQQRRCVGGNKEANQATCVLLALLTGAVPLLPPGTPAFIPFRAMTNAKVENLVVAGLSMAQSYLTNSAIRMHPTEWASGTGAGAAAAYMVMNRIGSTHDMLMESVEDNATVTTNENGDRRSSSDRRGAGGTRGDGRRSVAFTSTIRNTTSLMAGLQAMLRARHHPLEWTIDGNVYPPRA